MSNNPTCSVYIAEDHQAVRELLVLYFSTQANYTVIGQGGSGQQVLQDCRRLKPHLLLLDISLIGLSGIEVAHALNRDSDAPQILVVTSHIDPEIIRLALRAGVRGIVEKASGLSLWQQAIESVAAGRAFFGPEVLQAVHRAFSTPDPVYDARALTPREREVLQLVAEGKSNKEIALTLGISPRTAENHRHHLMSKFSAHNAADLTREAFRLGLVIMGSTPPFAAAAVESVIGRV